MSPPESAVNASPDAGRGTAEPAGPGIGPPGTGPVGDPPPDARRSRWVDHRERRRAELVEAAIDAIRTHGAAAGMEQVAAQAGISKPVLYRYFGDKSELWIAVGDQLAARVLTAIEPAVAEIREERGVIAAAIGTYLAAIEADPELYRLLLHQTAVPEVHRLFAGAVETVAGGLARVIGDRLRALGLDAGPAEPWAYGLVGCVQTVGTWWLRHRQPISREALTEYLTTLIWSGVAAVREAADLPGGLAGLPAEPTGPAR
jgi:AcrR family transcriptional regulator